MSTNKIPTRRVTGSFWAGLFVIAGSLAVIGTIIWLGASQFLKENSLYVTYFEGSVEGLDPGSPVKYLGVPVGSVSKINVAPDGKIVEIVMSIDKKIKINDSMRIKAEMAGIAGGKFMQIYYQTDDKLADMYPRISFEPPYPLIKSSPSGIQEIEIAAREVMNNFMQIKAGDISENTVQFLSSAAKFFNNEELYGIVSELNQSGAKLNHILGNADSSDIINNLAKTSTQLLQTANDLKRFSQSLNSEVDKINLAAKVERSFTAYDSAMANISKMIDVLGWRGETAMFGITEAIEDLKQTNRKFKKSLNAISEHPTGVFFSNPPKPEK